MERTDASPDGYLATFEGEQRETMEALDRLVTEALPGRRRTLWTGVFWGGTEQTILGYGDLVQPRPKGPAVEWFIVGLARQKRHYSLYVNVADEGQYLGRRYAERLGKVKIGASSIGFSRLEDVDLDVLRELLEQANRLAA